MPDPDVPVRLFCEFQRPEEQWLPLRATRGTEPTWVPRTTRGHELVEAVVADLPGVATTGLAAWVACDTVTTRALVAVLRQHGVPKKMIVSQGYWVPPT